MANNYYDHSTYPSPSAPGASAQLRAELELIEAGFNKLPTITANALKVVRVNTGATGLEAVTLDGMVIGAVTPAAITGTTITATINFAGNLTGNVTGNVTSAGSSSFQDVTINGSLNMNSGTAGTITGLSAPSAGTDAATKTYVDTEDALKLNKSGGTMSGVLDMGGQKITSIGTPTLSGDAATKTYVDTAISNLIGTAPATLDTLGEISDALADNADFAGTMVTQLAAKLDKAGGTMTGPIAMGTQKITGLGTPTLDADASTKLYVDTADALKLPKSGGTMSGAIAMGTNKITGLGTPTVGTDAATKDYIDTTFGSTAAAAASAAAALASQNAAATSASNALTSENNAAASYDAFDDRYLGSKAANPTLDNDGNALLTGALYWNSVASEMRVYTGSVWSTAYIPASGAITSTAYTMSTNKLLGRGTAATGVIEEITLGTGLTLAGTTLNASVSAGLDIGAVYAVSRGFALP